MSLDNFFSINLPYGLKRNANNEWFAFNREYLPLGWNSKKDQQTIYDDSPYGEFPVYTTYKNLHDDDLNAIAMDADSIYRDEQGRPHIVFLYSDNSNPVYAPQFWDAYFQKIKTLSLFQV